MSDEHLRQLTLERAELIDRLAKAHTLIAVGQLYVQWYGEEHGVPNALKVAEQMKAYHEAGLFGDKNKGQANG